MFTRDFIESVSAGSKFEEVRSLSPLDALKLGLAVKQYEKELGVVEFDKQFDDEAMGNYMMKRNEPLATIKAVTFFKKDTIEQD